MRAGTKIQMVICGTHPMYWRLFDRIGLNNEELVDDIDCLAHCVRTQKPPYKLSPKDRLYVYEYAFDPNQEFKGSSDRYFVLGKERTDGKNLSITFIKEDSRLDEGYIALKTGEELDDIVTLIPDENIIPSNIEIVFLDLTLQTILLSRHSQTPLLACVCLNNTFWIQMDIFSK